MLKLKITCECQEVITIPVSMLGKELQCPKCKKVDKVALSSDNLLFLLTGSAVSIFMAITMGFAAGLIALVIFLVSFVLHGMIRQINDNLKKEEAKEKEKVRSDFTPPPECPKCSEDNWELLKISPNYKSANWKCSYCNKKITIKLNSNCEKNKRSDRAIPKAVQNEVWRRDQGRCVECGSKENVEYDHIIPWSKGGGNTARNIQLLCQECNRNKSDKEPGTW